MAEASFMGTLRIIAIVILSYYLIKFLFRIFAPMIFQQVVKKAGQKIYEQQQNMYNTPQQQQYADTPQKPQEKKKIGEYIDYEEIE